jgi:hypothetical protein
MYWPKHGVLEGKGQAVLCLLYFMVPAAAAAAYRSAFCSLPTGVYVTLLQGSLYQVMLDLV